MLKYLFAGYVVVSIVSIWQTSLPLRKCTNGGRPLQTIPGQKPSCVMPMVQVGDPVALRLYIQENDTWAPVKTCQLNLTLPEGKHVFANTTCNVSLPIQARIRNQTEPLRAKLKIVSVRDDISKGRVISEANLDLTRFKKVDGSQVPQLKYGKHPILLRFVNEVRLYAGPPPLFRSDGIAMIPWNRTRYRPRFYVDENALTHSSQLELAPPEDHMDRPPISISIQVSNISPLQDSLIQQMTLALNTAEQVLSGSELDEVRYWLRDERIYRFLLTQLISFIHIWLEYMAFADEIRFYRGRNNFTGVSASSVLTRLLCSIIIFLYLLDGGGTSWVVLLSILSGVLVDAWKAWKLLKPTLSWKYPFILFGLSQTEKERQAAEYDMLAIKYLSYVMYPLVGAWALYSLRYESYKSLWSWFISNAANGVYTFGFIALTPQLYVNYRLKSVAHLPWKVFVYKIFNTFIDDVFAFLIDMPWKHRLMTLRDDVVFALFLVQAYIYRVDKSRVNEYGYSYEESSMSPEGGTDQSSSDAGVPPRPPANQPEPSASQNAISEMANVPVAGTKMKEE